jgi:hypothetical protein
MKGSEKIGIETGHSLRREEGRDVHAPETMSGGGKGRVPEIISDSETDPGIEKAPAREMIRKPERCGKEAEDPEWIQTVLQRRIGPKVDLVHVTEIGPVHGTEIGRLDMQPREVA